VTCFEDFIKLLIYSEESAQSVTITTIISIVDIIYSEYIVEKLLTMGSKQQISLNPTTFDPIEGYKILNTILPKDFQTKFPYSTHNIDKLTLTKKIIDILVKSDKAKEKKDKSTTKAKPVTGSNEATSIIIIYG
jgi:hypothetical protein